VVGKVILPAVMSPVIAGVVAAVGTWLVYKVTEGVAQRHQENGFGWGQIGTASLVSLAHGTNDAQKTMGVITLALIAAGDWSDTTNIPTWVKVALRAGHRRGHLPRRLADHPDPGQGPGGDLPPQGMAAESASAAVILCSSQLGFALSTTPVATGSILGTGVGRRGALVRWAVALRGWSRRG